MLLKHGQMPGCKRSARACSFEDLRIPTPTYLSPMASGRALRLTTVPAVDAL